VQGIDGALLAVGPEIDQSVQNQRRGLDRAVYLTTPDERAVLRIKAADLAQGLVIRSHIEPAGGQGGRGDRAVEISAPDQLSALGIQGENGLFGCNKYHLIPYRGRGGDLRRRILLPDQLSRGGIQAVEGRIASRKIEPALPGGCREIGAHLAGGKVPQLLTIRAQGMKGAIGEAHDVDHAVMNQGRGGHSPPLGVLVYASVPDCLACPGIYAENIAGQRAHIYPAFFQGRA